MVFDYTLTIVKPSHLMGTQGLQGFVYWKEKFMLIKIRHSHENVICAICCEFRSSGLVIKFPIFHASELSQLP